MRRPKGTIIAVNNAYFWNYINLNLNNTFRNNSAEKTIFSKLQLQTTILILSNFSTFILRG